MNVVLWVVQVVLALHTVVGAIWKFSNSEQAVPTLSAIPHGVWMSLIVVEFLCAAGLVLPFIKSLGVLAPIAATIIAAEMLLYCAVHLATGHSADGQVVYWLVVAVVAGFLAYGRFALSPIQ